MPGQKIEKSYYPLYINQIPTFGEIRLLNRPESQSLGAPLVKRTPVTGPAPKALDIDYRHGTFPGEGRHPFREPGP